MSLSESAEAEKDTTRDLLFRKGSAGPTARTPQQPAADAAHAADADAEAVKLLAKKGAAAAEGLARNFRRYDHKESLEVEQPPEAGRSPDMEEPDVAWYKFDGVAPAPAAKLFELDENAPTCWYKYEPDPPQPAGVKSNLAAPASLSIRGFARPTAEPAPPVEALDEALAKLLAEAPEEEEGTEAAPVAASQSPARALQQYLERALAMPPMDSAAAVEFARDFDMQEAWRLALAGSAPEPTAPAPRPLPELDGAAAETFRRDCELRADWEAALAASGAEAPAIPAAPLPRMDAALAAEFGNGLEMAEAWVNALAASGVEMPTTEETPAAPLPAVDAELASEFSRVLATDEAWASALAGSGGEVPEPMQPPIPSLPIADEAAAAELGAAETRKSPLALAGSGMPEAPQRPLPLLPAAEDFGAGERELAAAWEAALAASSGEVLELPEPVLAPLPTIDLEAEKAFERDTEFADAWRAAIDASAADMPPEPEPPAIVAATMLGAEADEEPLLLDQVATEDAGEPAGTGAAVALDRPVEIAPETLAAATAERAPTPEPVVAEAAPEPEAELLLTEIVAAEPEAVAQSEIALPPEEPPRLEPPLLAEISIYVGSSASEEHPAAAVEIAPAPVPEPVMAEAAPDPEAALLLTEIVAAEPEPAAQSETALPLDEPSQLQPALLAETPVYGGSSAPEERPAAAVEIAPAPVPGPSVAEAAPEPEGELLLTEIVAADPEPATQSEIALPPEEPPRLQPPLLGEIPAYGDGSVSEEHAAAAVETTPAPMPDPVMAEAEPEPEAALLLTEIVAAEPETVAQSEIAPPPEDPPLLAEMPVYGGSSVSEEYAAAAVEIAPVAVPEPVMAEAEPEAALLLTEIVAAEPEAVAQSEIALSLEEPSQSQPPAHAGSATRDDVSVPDAPPVAAVERMPVPVPEPVAAEVAPEPGQELLLTEIAAVEPDETANSNAVLPPEEPSRLPLPVPAGIPIYGSGSAPEMRSVAESETISVPEPVSVEAVLPPEEPPRLPPPVPSGVPIYRAGSAPGMRGRTEAKADAHAELAGGLAEMIGSMLDNTEFATQAGAKARQAERVAASDVAAAADALDRALMEALAKPSAPAKKRRGFADPTVGLAAVFMIAAGGYLVYSLDSREDVIAHESVNVVALAMLPPADAAETSAAAIAPAEPPSPAPDPLAATASARPVRKDPGAWRPK